MRGPAEKSRHLISILGPTVSFAVLAVVVVSAVLVGNYGDQVNDECRPLGTGTGNGGDSGTSSLIVFSSEKDGLVLCDVPDRTEEYESSGARDRVSDFAFITANNVTGSLVDQPGFEGFRGRLVYQRGEFGDLEDCGPFGARSYESEDFDGFDGSDTFHPDRLQSCWYELVVMPNDDG